MTKIQLMAQIERLEGEKKQLRERYEAQIADLKQQLEALSEPAELAAKVEELSVDLHDAEKEIERLQGRLETVAGKWAELGLIHPTPHAKQRWIEGLST